MFTKIIISLLLSPLAISSSALPVVKGVSHSFDNGWQKVNRSAIEPIISAPSAVVIDANSNQVLYKKNQDQLRPIASITKLITSYLYLTKKPGTKDQIVTMLVADEKKVGYKYIYRGERVSVLTLLNISLIGSDNNAAAALARIGGFSENFEDTANEILQNFKLSNTHLIEPTGLSSDNVSNALETAYMAQKIFHDLPELSAITRQQDFEFSPLNSNQKRMVYSTNDLLGTELFEIVGGKTGHTEDAGYCIVIKAVNDEGKEIIISILGASTSEARFHDAKILAWWVFKNFE